MRAAPTGPTIPRSLVALRSLAVAVRRYLRTRMRCASLSPT